MRFLSASVACLVSFAALVACSSSSSSSSSFPASNGGASDSGATADAARFTDLAHHSPASCTATPAQVAVDAGACDHVQKCSADTDCTAKANGRCIYENEMPVADCGHYCVYDACSSDSDCASDEACVCHDTKTDCVQSSDGFSLCGLANTCVKAACRSDADCPSGACTSAYGQGCGAFLGYRCRSNADQCVTDADCTSGSFCAYDGSKWACGPAAACP